MLSRFHSFTVLSAPPVASIGPFAEAKERHRLRPRWSCASSTCTGVLGLAASHSVTFQSWLDAATRFGEPANVTDHTSASLRLKLRDLLRLVVIPDHHGTVHMPGYRPRSRER